MVKPTVLVANSHTCGNCKGVQISFDQTEENNGRGGGEGWECWVVICPVVQLHFDHLHFPFSSKQ